MEKSELRAAMRARRKRLAQADPMAAGRLADHARELLDICFSTAVDFTAIRPPRRIVIAVYRAQGSEIDPAPLAQALSAGADLALPVAVARDAALVFRRWTPGDPLEVDMSGVPAPLPLAGEVTPDLILIPLIAFDRHGGRLGQGGGYYDRTLADLRDRIPRPWFVGLAYTGQEVDRLVMEPHDQRLDGVLTEAGYCAARCISH